MSGASVTAEDIADVIASARNDSPETRRRRFDEPIVEFRAGQEIGTAFLLEFDIPVQHTECGDIVPGDDEHSVMATSTMDTDGDTTKFSDAVDASLYDTVIQGITQGFDAEESAIREILDKKAFCSELYQHSEEAGTAVFSVIIGDQWEKTLPLQGSTIHDTLEDVMYNVVSVRGNAVMIESQDSDDTGTRERLPLRGNDSLHNDRYLIIDATENE